MPQTIKVIESKFNGQVKLVMFAGKPRIMVNNMIQSGGMVEVIWRKAIQSINNQQLAISNCLILGLGGGTVAKLINYSFPKVKILGVEIDPVIIKLGRKHFELDRIKNLRVIQGDAINFILNYKSGIKNYELILVDMYIGGDFPKKTESKQFLLKLKKLLSKNGIIVFNRLFYGKHKKGTERFINKLDKVFKDVKLVQAHSNLLIFCS